MVRTVLYCQYTHYITLICPHFGIKKKTKSMIFHEKNVKIVFILFLLHSKCYELLHASRRNNNNEIQYTNILTQKSPPVSIILTGFAVIQLYMNISASIYSQNKENLQIFSDFFFFSEIHPAVTLRKLFRFQKIYMFFHRTLSNSFISGTYGATRARYPTVRGR